MRTKDCLFYGKLDGFGILQDVDSFFLFAYFCYNKSIILRSSMGEMILGWERYWEVLWEKWFEAILIQQCWRD